ncbi:MAG: hypothetical protein QHC40_02110 [Sphingobium sp.]|nr:hypothetical protein [Sphingobium sp.]
MIKPAGNPFRYFNSSPEVIRLAVMMYVRYPLSLRNVEGLLFERGIGPPPIDTARLLPNAYERNWCRTETRGGDLPDQPVIGRRATIG